VRDIIRFANIQKSKEFILNIRKLAMISDWILQRMKAVKEPSALMGSRLPPLFLTNTFFLIDPKRKIFLFFSFSPKSI
jgi:hypothetical protein